MTCLDEACLINFDLKYAHIVHSFESSTQKKNNRKYASFQQPQIISLQKFANVINGCHSIKR